jgi:hypothetical protein
LADAHLKRIASRIEMRIMGREVVVAVTDGRRRKRVLVKSIGE